MATVSESLLHLLTTVSTLVFGGIDSQPRQVTPIEISKSISGEVRDQHNKKKEKLDQHQLPMGKGGEFAGVSTKGPISSKAKKGGDELEPRGTAVPASAGKTSETDSPQFSKPSAYRDDSSSITPLPIDFQTNHPQKRPSSTDASTAHSQHSTAQDKQDEDKSSSKQANPAVETSEGVAPHAAPSGSGKISSPSAGKRIMPTRGTPVPSRPAAAPIPVPPGPVVAPGVQQPQVQQPQQQQPQQPPVIGGVQLPPPPDLSLFDQQQLDQAGQFQPPPEPVDASGLPILTPIDAPDQLPPPDQWSPGTHQTNVGLPGQQPTAQKGQQLTNKPVGAHALFAEITASPKALKPVPEAQKNLYQQTKKIPEVATAKSSLKPTPPKMPPSQMQVNSAPDTEEQIKSSIKQYENRIMNLEKLLSRAVTQSEGVQNELTSVVNASSKEKVDKLQKELNDLSKITKGYRDSLKAEKAALLRKQDQLKAKMNLGNLAKKTASKPKGPEAPLLSEQALGKAGKILNLLTEKDKKNLLKDEPLVKKLASLTTEQVEELETKLSNERQLPFRFSLITQTIGSILFKTEEATRIKNEEARIKLEAEEVRLKKEEEERKLEALKFKTEEATRIKNEEERKLEELKLKADEDTRIKLEAERKLEELKLKADEATRLKKEAEELTLKTEEETRLKKEEEDRLQKEEEVRLAAAQTAEEDKKRLEEEARLKKEAEERTLEEQANVSPPPPPPETQVSFIPAPPPGPTFKTDVKGTETAEKTVQKWADPLLTTEPPSRADQKKLKEVSHVEKSLANALTNRRGSVYIEEDDLSNSALGVSQEENTQQSRESASQVTNLKMQIADLQTELRTNPGYLNDIDTLETANLAKLNLEIEIDSIIKNNNNDDELQKKIDQKTNLSVRIAKLEEIASLQKQVEGLLEKMEKDLLEEQKHPELYKVKTLVHSQQLELSKLNGDLTKNNTAIKVIEDNISQLNEKIKQSKKAPPQSKDKKSVAAPVTESEKQAPKKSVTFGSFGNTIRGLGKNIKDVAKDIQTSAKNLKNQIESNLSVEEQQREKLQNELKGLNSKNIPLTREIEQKSKSLATLIAKKVELEENIKRQTAVAEKEKKEKEERIKAAQEKIKKRPIVEMRSLADEVKEKAKIMEDKKALGPSKTSEPSAPRKEEKTASAFDVMAERIAKFKLPLGRGGDSVKDEESDEDWE